MFLSRLYYERCCRRARTPGGIHLRLLGCYEWVAMCLPSQRTPSRHFGEQGPLVSFFAGFLRSAPYLLRIDGAVEAGYHRTVWT
jgi:hypothetical protein